MVEEVRRREDEEAEAETGKAEEVASPGNLPEMNYSFKRQWSEEGVTNFPINLPLNFH